jgi:N-acetylmuramoyl-L-alanine amidase
MKVALVVGHRKGAPGACNKNEEDFPKCEFEFNKKLINDLVERHLVSSSIDYDVVYRQSYKQLPMNINKLNPHIVISFHCNAFNTKASGTEVLYYHTSTNGKRMAEILQENFLDVLELPDRGIKPRHSEDRGGYLLRYTKAPCVIIEPFFIDNDEDYNRVKERWDDFVFAIYRSIEKILKEIY